MKEIFKKLKMTKKGIDNMNLRNLEEEIKNSPHSLADLLANKSWTDACGLGKVEVLTAFEFLRNQGEEATIEYIKKTMIL